MPQLGLEGFSTSDERLNDPKYDELKSYYLVAGTERLMKIFDGLAQGESGYFYCYHQCGLSESVVAVVC